MDISGGIDTGGFDRTDFHWSRGGDLNSTREPVEPPMTKEMKGQLVEGVEAQLQIIRHSLAQLAQHREAGFADVLSQTLSKLDASSPDYAEQVHNLYTQVRAEVEKVRHDG